LWLLEEECFFIRRVPEHGIGVIAPRAAHVCEEPRRAVPRAISGLKLQSRVKEGEARRPGDKKGEDDKGRNIFE